MAYVVDLTTMRDRARLYSGQRGGTFISDTEALTLVKQASAEYYDLLVSVRGHEFFRTDTTIAIVSGTSVYSLPADFYQLLSLDLEWSSDDVELLGDMASVRERAYYLNQQTWGRYAPKAYRIRRAAYTSGGGGESATDDYTNEVEILPTPTSAVTANLIYVPRFDETVSSIYSVNGWDKLPVLRAAIEMRMANRENANDLMALLERETERVENLASDRNAAHPNRVLDVSPELDSLQHWPYRGPAVEI